MVLHFQRGPENGLSIKVLPDYPCIVFSFRTKDIIERQQAIQAKGGSEIRENMQKIQELKWGIKHEEKLIEGADYPEANEKYNEGIQRKKQVI